MRVRRRWRAAPNERIDLVHRGVDLRRHAYAGAGGEPVARNREDAELVLQTQLERLRVFRRRATRKAECAHAAPVSFLSRPENFETVEAIKGMVSAREDGAGGLPWRRRQQP